MERMSAHLWPSQRLAFMKMNSPDQSAAATTLTEGQKGWTSLYETVAEAEAIKRYKRAKQREYLIYIIAISALAILMGSFLFLLWPRVPTVDIADVLYGDGTELSQPLGPQLAILNQENSILPKDFPGVQKEFLSVRLQLEMRITSNNFLTLPVNDLEVLIRAEGLDFGAGLIEEPIKLQARGHTWVLVPIDLMLHEARGNNFFIDLLRSSCSPNPAARKPISLDCYTTIHVNMLESFRIQPPTLHGIFDLDCPWNIDEVFGKSNSSSPLKRRFEA
ncbi:hypothetical protein DSO57_1006896 [Entomophthora muscae]|uniref:Uncharacterized protein n=1 Tax=Entomophthora muscae TaxID=34485 RepID=A0ACC2U5L9_9FUNG|nr:hypothetical protein DSO57_1006896 [Entomophthora muscae]